MSRKFEFRLARVRALRERAEDRAKEDLAGAMSERERWAERLDEAGSQLHQARSAKRGAASGGVTASDMLAHQAFLERAERATEAAEIDLSRQDAEVDARRSALQHAAVERQVLERLKANKAAQHRRADERREGAMLDELAISRHRRGRTA